MATPDAAAAERLRREVDDRRRADAAAATELAVKTALRDAKIDERLTDAEHHLAEINGSQAETAKTLKEMQRTLGGVEESIRTNSAITKALEDRGLSTRTFYLGLAGLGLMLGGILAGTGHL
jgi:hypothetical protein